MVISGNTRLIAHLGYPTASFKADDLQPVVR